ncbi:MAG: hypothetical protein WC375_05405 [Methanomassiliicoccales archaeon]|jgi:hypothetical protein
MSEIPQNLKQNIIREVKRLKIKKNYCFFGIMFCIGFAIFDTIQEAYWHSLFQIICTICYLYGYFYYCDYVSNYISLIERLKPLIERIESE